MGFAYCLIPSKSDEDFTQAFEKQVPFRFTVNETFDVGCDLVLPVSNQYLSPFAFTGTIEKVMVDTGEATFDELAAEVKARLAMSIQ